MVADRSRSRLTARLGALCAVWLVSASILLSACGGGGGGDASPARAPTGTTTGHFAYVPNVDGNNISAYDIRSDGSLSPVAGSPFAAGSVPFQAVISPSGKFLYVGNEGTAPYTHNEGSGVSVFAINPTNGALTLVPGSPFSAGRAADFLAFDISGAYLYVLNAASNDISTFTVDAATGSLTSMGAPIAVGVNPQAIAVDPSGKFVLVANGTSNNVSVFAINPSTGALTQVPGSPFVSGRVPYRFAFGAGGKFVYVNNDGAGLSAYSLNATTGELAALAGSPFAISTTAYISADRAGAYLYVPVTNGLSVYAIDATTGTLTLAGGPYPAGADTSVVSIESSGRFLYLSNSADGTVSGYAIDATTGALNAVPGATFAAGTYPLFIATF